MATGQFPLVMSGRQQMATRLHQSSWALANEDVQHIGDKNVLYFCGYGSNLIDIDF
jgi:hypothetical protein